MEMNLKQNRYTWQVSIYFLLFLAMSMNALTQINAGSDLTPVLLHNCAISIDIYCPINKLYSIIIFSLLINAVILLLNCLVLVLYLYIHFVSLKHYFLCLTIIWTFI